MTVSEHRRDAKDDIRELRGLVIELASRVGVLEGLNKAIFALLLALLAIAITILIRVW